MDSGKDPGIEIITRRQQSQKGVQDMKVAEKKAVEMVRRLANENFSLSDLNVSFSYTGENTEERKTESERFNRQFLQEVEKRRGAIC